MFGIDLNRHNEIPLARRLYLTLRNQMTEGNLKSGDILPSTRELARELSISAIPSARLMKC